MTEAEAIEEFEKLWAKGHPPIHPNGCMCWCCELEQDEKPTACYWWLAAWRLYGKKD